MEVRDARLLAEASSAAHPIPGDHGELAEGDAFTSLADEVSSDVTASIDAPRTESGPSGPNAKGSVYSALR
eukprot:SM000184S03775  [mRNA]  locus=s184:247007:247478:+ [translate_table: standard]